VADFIGLDEEIAGSVIAALRADAGKVPLDLSDAHELRLSDRERARTEAAVAEHAVTAFTRERATAGTALGDATRAVDVLAMQVLSHKAEALAERSALLKSEQWNIAATLNAYDRIASGAKQSLPHRVYTAINDAGAAGQRPSPDDLAQWSAALDALRADASAEPTITLSPAVVPPLSSPRISWGPPQPAPGRIDVPPVMDDGDPHNVQPEENC
jgi:hypothetical protein